MPSNTPPSKESLGVYAASHVVVRPFVDAEAVTCFEQQPVPRPVLDVEKSSPNVVKILDPAARYRVKREVAVSALHWFPPDGDESSSPVVPATLASVTQPTADAMARQLSDGFNATAVVCGHTKSGKSTILFGEMSAPLQGKVDVSDASSAHDTSTVDTVVDGLFPRFASSLFAALAQKPDNSAVVVTVEVAEIDDVHGIVDLQARKPSTGTRHSDPEPIKVKEDAGGPLLSGAVRSVVNSAPELIALGKTAFLKYRKGRIGKAQPHHFAVLVRCQETLKFADPENDAEQITKQSYSTAIFALVIGRPTAFYRCVDLAAAKSASDPSAPTAAKIPFRESSLTRLLQDFFGGNAYPYAITCVSPFFGAQKDATFCLEVAAKLGCIRCYPRQSYDESTSEFRRLDREVSHLSTELHAATEAHNIIQNELNMRYAALTEAKAVHEEQRRALDALRQDIEAESNVTRVKMLRLKRAFGSMHRREQDLRSENQSTVSAINDFESRTAAARASRVASEEQQKSDVDALTDLKTRQTAADTEITRQEARYEVVAISKGGIGGVKETIEREHRAAIGPEVEDTEKIQGEIAQIVAKRAEIEMPLRMAQMAANSINEGKERLQTAKNRSDALDDEERRLPTEIADLEKEIEKLEIEAAPSGCCTVA